MNAQLTSRDATMSVGDWIITLVVLAIPLVNIVMFLVWAFAGSTNINRQNYCRAALILAVIGFVIVMLLLSVAGMSMSDLYH